MGDVGVGLKSISNSSQELNRIVFDPSSHPPHPPHILLLLTSDNLQGIQGIQELQAIQELQRVKELQQIQEQNSHNLKAYLASKGAAAVEQLRD